jgi:hypothetical protein
VHEMVWCVKVRINLFCKLRLYNSRNYHIVSYYVQPHVLLKIGYLDIMLTVHLSIVYFIFISNLIHYSLPSIYNVWVSSFLYMFQASQAHHQEV